MIGIQIWEFIKSLFGEKRETLFSILIVTVLAFALYAVYDQYIKEKDVSAEDLKALKEQQREEIKKLREYQIESDIEHQQEISELNRACRVKIDSIEEYYYVKFKELRNSVKRIETKISKLNN